MAADSLAQVRLVAGAGSAPRAGHLGGRASTRHGAAVPGGAGGRYGRAAARVHLLSGPSLDISASQIRRRVAAGRAIRYLVPRAVEELIVDRRLYRR